MTGLRFLVFATAVLAGLCAVHGRNTRGIGPETDIKDAPWLAQLHFGFGNGDFSSYTSCAGSIVGKNKILTAAHCADLVGDVANPRDYIQVSVGGTEKKAGKYYEVAAIDVHPEADRGENRGHDLAVITTVEPIEFNDRVQPIDLVTEEVTQYDPIVGGGWGVVRDSEFGATREDYSPSLRTFPMQKYGNRYCADLVEDVLPPTEIRGIICARPVGGTACAGDSGSGLWVPAKGDKPARLAGVLSAGDMCDLKNGTPLYVDLLSETVRDFMSKHFDMSGRKLRTDEVADKKTFPGLFG